MRWVTRERPKTDRIACPWLIRRFIDPQAEIRYVPADQVLAVAEIEAAHSFDAPYFSLPTNPGPRSDVPTPTEARSSPLVTCA